MTKYKFTLEPYKNIKSIFICPECKKRTFKKYIDTLSGEYLDDTVGRCNREIKCGNHKTPKQFFSQTGTSFNKLFRPLNLKIEYKETSFISTELLLQSMQEYEVNNFVKFLIDLFDVEITQNLIHKYFIGTSKNWRGASIFWQIDQLGNIRTGKIMLYDSHNGKRITEPINHFNWVHTATNQINFNLKQCFFGAHLLNDPSKPIAIVESEKTAIISSAFFPDLIWLATGGISHLTIEKCKAITGRDVFLFPDIKGYEKWKAKANEYKKIANFQVSDLLELIAVDQERKDGLDIADYLI